ncbi:MAG: RHS repeat-associated core domain-containing protein [Flavobacteriaceae bacterium]
MAAMLWFLFKYIYDATGIKLKKVNSTGTTTEYAGNYMYEGTGISTDLQFFSHPEGYVSPSAVEGQYNYIYQYKDHLGNIRLTYADDPSNPGTPTIIEESNYYPFGLKHSGYNGGGDTALGNDMAQRWKYNGMELDESFDIDTYDFGARNYDPALGRWMNIDPLAEKFVAFSPFSYALNSPLFFVDPDGKEPIPGPFRGMVTMDRYGSMRVLRITTEQRQALEVYGAVAGFAGMGTTTHWAIGLASFVNAAQSSESNWEQLAEDRLIGLAEAGKSYFEGVFEIPEVQPALGPGVKPTVKAMSTLITVGQVLYAVNKTEPTVQETLEDFTFTFLEADIQGSGISAVNQSLFIPAHIANSKGMTIRGLENKANSMYLTVSIMTNKFDLTTKEGVLKAKKYLEKNQKNVYKLNNYIKKNFNSNKSEPHFGPKTHSGPDSPEKWDLIPRY